MHLATQNGKLSPARGGQAHILESRDSGKVTGMDNSRQMTEAKQRQTLQLNEQNEEHKMGSLTCLSKSSSQSQAAIA